jgi:hypothetical protein
MNVQRQADGRTVAYLTAQEWRAQPNDVKTLERGAKWLLVPLDDGKRVAEVVIIPTTQVSSPAENLQKSLA